jgi:hypothetical protein
MINKNKKDLHWFHSYKVVQTMDNLTESNFPVVSMEIGEEATIGDHLYAFERFLQSIGFVLPENSRLDFVENESESRSFEDLTVIEGDEKNTKNGTH